MKDKPDFVGHKKFNINEILNNQQSSIDNIIIDPQSEDMKWIKDTTEQIANWRAYFRSTYIRWALTINGLHIAKEKYESKKGDPTDFKISSLRQKGLESIAIWNMDTTATNCNETIPMIASWGLSDLYSNLEEFVFEIFKIYLNNHPDSLIKGKEFAHLRRLKRDAINSEVDKNIWESAWVDRLNAWQRKRLYDGLSAVFLSYINTAGLKAPSSFTQTTVETWAETIKGIAELRNCFTHGIDTVTKELADFSKTPYSMLFDFIEGKPLIIELKHLQSVECFLDQLLTALNYSLIECAGFKLPISN